MIGYASLNEVRIVFEDAGSGPVVLLLHGIPTQRSLWHKVTPHLLRRGLRSIAPDLAGFGASDAPPGVDIHVENQAAWMALLLRRLGVNRAVVVGHDIGGAVAQIMGVRHSRSVAGLVLVDSVFGDSWPVETMRRLADWDPAAAGKLHDLFVERLPGATTVNGMSDEEIRELMAPYEGDEGGLRLIRMARSLDSRHTLAIAAELSRLEVPIALVWGDHDTSQPLETVGRPLGRALGVEPLVVRAGHFSPLDAPAEIAGEIARIALEAAR